jgi:subtilisin family serine protease
MTSVQLTPLTATVDYKPDAPETDDDVVEAGQGEQGIHVGVIDAGVDTSHPAFRDSKVDVVTVAGGTASVVMSPSQNPDHGTAVLSLILGKPALGWQGGLARLARATFVEVGPGLTEPELVEALNYLHQIGCRVINLSMKASKPTRHLDRRLGDLRKDVLIVAAIGDDGQGTVAWPGACENVLSVGSCGRDYVVAEPSGSGAFRRSRNQIVPSVVAVGENVTVAHPRHGLVRASGPSIATARVSAIAARMFEARPNATVDQIDTCLRDSAECVRGTHDQRWGRCEFGVVTLRRAIGRVKDVVPAPTPTP